MSPVERALGASWHPRGEPRFGVVLCPGRLNEPRSLSWLAAPLACSGGFVAAVSYPDRGRYLVDDAAAAIELGQRIRNELPDQAPCFVVGHSRGGTVSLLTAAWHEGWDGAIALSPTTHQERLVRGLALFAPTRYELMIAMRGCAPDEDPDYYDHTSPALHADELRVPVLLVHGTLDLVVPHDHSIWLKEGLTDVDGADVELVLLDGVGHFFERMYSGYALDEVARIVVEWATRHASMLAP